MTVVGALHGTAVSAADDDGEEGALLILGAPGAGKSSLAIELIALGARLISDDVVEIRCDGGNGVAVAAAPPSAPAAIEARGLGLLPTPLAEPAPIRAVVDLDRPETERLPGRRVWRWRAASAPLLLRPEPLRPAALMLFLRAGGALNPESALVRPRRAEDGLAESEARGAGFAVVGVNE